MVVQSGDPTILARAAELGADGVIFSPEDVRPDALNAAVKALPETFALAIPMVLAQNSLEGLHAWARAHADRIQKTYLSNVAHFAYPWPGECAADFSLNMANPLAAEQLREWGCTSFTPSVELNAAQIDALGGPRELIVHGRLPLMQLRHCPYRAVHGLKGKHADCRRCDHCNSADHVNARRLTDRTGADFPLRRVATDDGCIVRVLNSVPLMLLKRIQRLPKADAWRLLIDDPADLTALRLYKMAACGENFRDDPAWKQYESLNTTTGHYFRGAE